MPVSRSEHAAVFFLAKRLLCSVVSVACKKYRANMRYCYCVSEWKGLCWTLTSTSLVSRGVISGFLYVQELNISSL